MTRPARERMPAHDCPGSGGNCAAKVPYHQLACRAHWFQLLRSAPALARAVNAAYHGPGQGSPEHTEALVAALDWYREN